MSEFPTLDPLDSRLNAFRPDLAEMSLKGKVSAERYVEGKPARVSVAFTDMRNTPDPKTGLDTQLLFGEIVRVLEQQDEWAWVKSETDGYVRLDRGWALWTIKPARPLTSFVHRAPSFIQPPISNSLTRGSGRWGHC